MIDFHLTSEAFSRFKKYVETYPGCMAERVKIPDSEKAALTFKQGRDRKGILYHTWVAVTAEGQKRFWDKCNGTRTASNEDDDARLMPPPPPKKKAALLPGAKPPPPKDKEEDDEEEDSEDDPMDDVVCAACGSGEDEENVLLCDGCPKGFHLYCLVPRLHSIPKVISGAPTLLGGWGRRKSASSHLFSWRKFLHTRYSHART